MLGLQNLGGGGWNVDRMHWHQSSKGWRGTIFYGGNQRLQKNFGKWEIRLYQRNRCSIVITDFGYVRESVN